MMILERINTAPVQDAIETLTDAEKNGLDELARKSALQHYERLSYETLPLRADTKDAFLKDWQHREPREMWKHAPENANVGIRCGGARRLAIVDADNKNEPRTSERVANFFAGLGLHENDYPQVATPNAGQHFYIALADERAGAYCQLSPEMGSGEFRYGRGAYVAAPPSQIGERNYILASGDFGKLPRVALSDLRPILASENTTPQSARLFPIASVPTPSRRALALLRGEGMERYHSRSEGEQAIITSLVNSGFEFDAILTLFLQHPRAGKFAELSAKNPKNALRWLRHSFENAQKWTRTHEGNARQLARAAREWAPSHQWTGRTGAIDCAVFLAHAEIAYRAGRIVYAASCRDVAELAGVGFRTSIRATHRLRELGLIVLEQEATFNLAATFRLVFTDTLSKYINVRECVNKNSAAHDVFRYAGLGKVALAVWNALQSDALTAREIIAKTGRSRYAVNRALERMFQLQMVGMDLTAQGETWYALENVDLNEIARHIGTYGKGVRQRAEHERQRAARRKWSTETRPPKRKRGKQ
ncbi:MAG: bifunctional DNA primase/polymerase [Chloroflexi bacterium]|nr:bifunctional DNA primase/polymerase [Chloroflexota bacterium]